MCAPDESSPETPAARGGPRAFLVNWRQPGPLTWKLQRLVVNNVRKISRGQHCCGNLGEPGC